MKPTITTTCKDNSAIPKVSTHRTRKPTTAVWLRAGEEAFSEQLEQVFAEVNNFNTLS